LNYKIKSALLVLFLVSLVVFVGVMVGQEGLTGASTVKTVACHDHADCNDKISQTEDVCKNPGTEFSICINKAKK
tara:strand:+ start:245 stop:469 length:225 start_codon:yes stop_codon:yes gene_type:complete